MEAPKRLVPGAAALAVAAATFAAPPTWPPKGTPHRLPITRDNWTSLVGDEKFGNNGAATRLKLKGQQEHILFDIDPAPLRGKVITAAVWHVRSASPQAPMLRTSVSTVAADWVEGGSSRYRRTPGASCFAQARLGEADWAYPGSTLLDVTFGRGHTLWAFAEGSPPDPAGWQAVAVDARVVAARLADLSGGFAAWDDVGSVWSFTGGKFTYTHFPNRYFYSRHCRGSEPWLEVWTDGEDHAPPGAVTDITCRTARLPDGEALVTWKTPADRGPAGTFGFLVRYRQTDPPGPAGRVPRYLVPFAGRPGQPVTMHLQDIFRRSGAKVRLGIAAVDAAGNVGPEAAREIVLAEDRPKLVVAPSALRPFPAEGDLPTAGGLKVAVLDMLDKRDPRSGRLIPPRPAAYLAGNHLFSAGRRLIRLQAARNEAVCFQVNLAGRAKKVRARLAFPDSPGLKAGLARLDYVATSAGPMGDVVVPLEGEFSVPFADDAEAAGAANVSLLAEVYVPHKTPAGTHRGTLTLSADGRSLALDVRLRVWDFTLPDKLSFIPEMNCYGTADPISGLAYYRLAHEHRLCINRLYYNWRGQPSRAPAWRDGRLDFSQWDRQFGPLLDGTAFADLPRAGEPVDVFYLPFNENWPADLYAHYRPAYWVEDAFTPAYAATLRKAFAQFAAHCDEKGFHETIFEFYLNNKVYYKRGGWRRCSAPWIFDEPVNTQDFWALRWYGILFHQAVDPARGGAKMWYRADVSRSHCDRDLFRGVLDMEVLGGADAQKIRMKRDERILWGGGWHMEYGSANDPAAANLQPVLWCLKAFAGGAVGVLPWQTIGSVENLHKGSATGLFIPRGGRVVPSVRVKAFRRGQQDVEYLALLGAVLDRPHHAVAAALARRIDLAGRVHKASAADAGTLRFARADPTALWQFRVDIAAMLSARRPPYRRCVRPMPSPRRDPAGLPRLGYVPLAPPLPPSAPEMDQPAGSGGR